MTPDQMLNTAALLFGIEKDAIFGRGRMGRVVEARHALAWALRQQEWSLESIGTYLRRDHSTIIDAIKSAERHRDRSPRYAECLTALATTPPPPPPIGWHARVEVLETRVAELEALVAELETLLQEARHG